MAKLPILEFPDPRLRTVAKPVGQVDDALRGLISDMFETMYDAPGIGLAATQVDVHLRLLVLDVSEDKSRPMVFINPEILDTEGSQVYQEGCLSVPGIYADVTRANQITVRLAYNLFTQKPQHEKEDFLNWTATSQYKQGTDYFRHNGAGEMLVFSAADFEDFVEPRPDLAPSMEAELEPVGGPEAVEGPGAGAGGDSAARLALRHSQL
mgnify:CR=1 FL=1